MIMVIGGCLQRYFFIRYSTYSVQLSLKLCLFYHFRNAVVGRKLLMFPTARVGLFGAPVG